MGKRIYANNRILNPFSGNTNVRIPINDDESRQDFTEAYFIIAFYDNSGQLVTPTGGTVTVNAEPVTGQTLSPGDGDSTFNMADVRASGLSPYTPPVFIGPVVAVNFSIQAPVGATQYSAFVWRT